MNKIIPDLIELIIKANNKIIDIYQQDFNYIDKKDKSPLTIADLESNKIICNGLSLINKKLNLDILIISEENKNLDFNQRKNYEYCWLVDPIDGTKEFIKKNGEFTTNIGLTKNGKVVFGIIGIPTQNLIYYGGIDFPSKKLNYQTNQTDIIKPRTITNPYIVVTSRSHINAQTKTLIETLPFNTTTISSGSSIKMLMVAEGTANYYPRVGPTMEWDTCAAHGILKGVNKNLTTFKNEELEYNKENLLNPFFQTN